MHFLKCMLITFLFYTSFEICLCSNLYERETCIVSQFSRKGERDVTVGSRAGKG